LIIRTKAAVTMRSLFNINKKCLTLIPKLVRKTWNSTSIATWSHMKNSKIIIAASGLWSTLSGHRRRQIFLLLGLMIFASFAEIISIGSVLPFLGVLTSPHRVFEISVAQPFIHLLGLKEPEQLLLPLTITFGVAAILTGILRLTLLWASTKLSFDIGADISNKIYRNTIYQPYSTHISRNSSEIINGVSKKAGEVIHTAVMPALTIISSFVMLAAILLTLVSIDPIIAATAFLGFGVIYGIVISVARRKLTDDSKVIAVESTKAMKSLQEGLGGIRDVLLDGSQEVYCTAFEASDGAMRRAQGNIHFIGLSPRYGMEALGMLLIAALAYTVAKRPEGISTAIPILGALALGAQRMIPVLQQAYWSWVAFAGGLASLQDTLDLLAQPLPVHVTSAQAIPLDYKKSFSLRKVSFNYVGSSKSSLKDISITIHRGSRLGIVGKTGGGKSTLLDIIMGLLPPTQGGLFVDDTLVDELNVRRWQLHIAHVPQNIYLADCSIAENIAFGVPVNKIDWDRVHYSAQQAQIGELIESLPDGYHANVGERGVRLSGGQRQRIGIARALYKRANVLVFDEATSALDSNTERSVMQAIDGLSKDLTVIIIAHRLSTLKGCSEIIELNNGEICFRGDYSQIISEA
jgi:ABC-type bacteriocin/lantibiotic exporter with double-glycine peptidase domain